MMAAAYRLLQSQDAYSWLRTRGAKLQGVTVKLPDNRTGKIPYCLTLEWTTNEAIRESCRSSDPGT